MKPRSSQLGPKMRPSGCVRSVNIRIEKMPMKPMTAMTGNSTRSPRNRIGMLNGILNLRGLSGSVRRSADQTEKDERVARRRTESVEVGQEIEAAFAVEETV